MLESILFSTDTAVASADSTLSKEELRSLIREVVREVVQEELAKLQPHETKTPRITLHLLKSRLNLPPLHPLNPRLQAWLS